MNNEIFTGKSILPGDSPDLTPLRVDRRFRTRILLVRHGESLANAARVFLGHTDLGLSERGYAQARATADYLKNEHIDAIYSSDLARAYATAVPIADYRSLEIITDVRLRELYIGKWENMRIDDIVTRWGEEYTVGWKQRFGTFTPPDGESVSDAGRRFYEAVLDIAKKHEGQCVLITAHAAVIRSFYAIVAGIPAERVGTDIDFPYNASVTTVYFDKSTLVPGEYSHSKHLFGI